MYHYIDGQNHTPVAKKGGGIIQENLKLINMSEIERQEVNWLWYPYIPFGKITILQGDPGEGKTTLILTITALLTNGKPMPECDNKGIHKGIGSVDITAAARSVLVVGRETDNPTVRIMGQTKSSLAPESKSIAFELDPMGGFRWIGYYDITADEIIYGCGKEPNKVNQAEETLREMLSNGEVKVSDIYLKLSGQVIGKRTVDTAKNKLGVLSIKTDGVWFWRLPEKGGCNIAES